MTALFSLPQLPAMRCDDGCGECCGVVPVSDREFARIKAVVEARGIKPRFQGLTCPLFIEGRCSIYEARPALCRLFGHCEGMTCSRGYNVNTDAETERKYQAVIRERTTRRLRTLHELVAPTSVIGHLLSTLVKP